LKRLKIFLILLCLSAALDLRAELRYNFTYKFQGAAKGVILLIFSYRAFYESSASVNFTAQKTEDGDYKFFFDGIADTGYMMRTTGLTGKTLVILTADYDLERSIPFADARLAEFPDIAPYYAGFIRRKKKFRFKLYSRDRDSIRFIREKSGAFRDWHIDFDVRFEYHPEVLNIDFNIYKILVEMLKTNDHPVINTRDLSALRSNPRQKWSSPPLDFSGSLNRIGPLAARFVGQVAHFKQERPFRVEYRLTEANSSAITIVGETRPDIEIWGKFIISRFFRRLKLRLKDEVLLEDVLRVDIQKMKSEGEFVPHNGMIVEAALKLIE
jgi:hypothetical protein